MWPLPMTPTTRGRRGPPAGPRRAARASAIARSQASWASRKFSKLLSGLPAWRRPASNERPAATGNLRPVDDYPAVDPLDGQPRNLGFLLDSRLAVDGLVVLRNGRLVAERYRNGLAADKPRLLLEASRPLLNLLGAISISQGKLAADKPVTRYLPALASSGGLRKISLQRLLDGDESLAWPPEDLAAWRQAGGWTGSQAGSDMRAWLTQGGRWEKPQREPLGAMAAASPEDATPNTYTSPFAAVRTSGPPDEPAPRPESMSKTPQRVDASAYTSSAIMPVPREG
mgnify:CR=1 FL=1